MTEPDSPTKLRRLELEQAFQHLGSLAAEVDLSGIVDPKQAWLAAIRGTLSRYGDVGPPVSLKGVTFTSASANGILAEWVTAEGASNDRRIVYIHGGGWAGGSPHDYRAISATLAHRSRASVLMVDYRLAPEHPFPAGLDDCAQAFEWARFNGPMSEQSGRSDNDPAERISLAGDSAGGNLAAATCVRLATSNRRMPDRLALIAGTLDHVSMSERIGADDLVCTPEALAIPVELYLKNGQSAADPHISPVFASTDLLAKFPPTLLQASTCEALLYDSKKFADRLERAGVRVTLSLWPELPHVWHAFLGLFPEATEALAEIADFLER